MLLRRAAWLSVFLVTSQFLVVGDTKTAPDFKEVYDLLRTNLTGLDENALNRAAVEGLLGKLESHVRLVDTEGKSQHGTNAAASITGSVLESRFGYIRVNALNTEGSKAFADTF